MEGSELADGRPRDGGRRTPRLGLGARRAPRLVRWHAVRDAHGAPGEQCVPGLGLGLGFASSAYKEGVEGRAASSNV